ncbi:MAG: TonB-dependent receptor [Bacteroidota bacterium]
MSALNLSSGIFCCCLVLVLGFVEMGGVYAQSAITLVGTVQDQEGKPMAFADVVLLRSDSSVYKFAYAEDGAFQVDQVDEGLYILQVTTMTCTPFYQELSLDKEMRVDIILSCNEVTLEEVTVAARRKIFENKDGNVRFNVEHTILKAEPNPLSILSKLPYVQIAPDGSSITVVGRGTPLIYQNKQRIDLDRLSTISVDDIESIEIINNPSAKYEAGGRSVILIKTKRNPGEGYRIELSETLAQRELLNNYIALNTTIKAEAAEVKLNLGFNDLQPWEKLQTEYDVFNRERSSSNEGVAISDRNEYILGTGFYYPIREEDYFSVDYNMRLSRTTGTIGAQASSTIDEVEDQVQTRSTERDDRDYYNGALNYEHTLQDGELFVGAQFSSFAQAVDSDIENSFAAENFLPEQRRDQDFSIRSYAGRLDYSTVLETETTVEAGWNSTVSHARSQQVILPADNQQATIDTDYRYEEQIHAAYTQITHSFGKVNLSTGVRLELASVEGKFDGNSNSLIDRNNLYVLPKARLNIPIDSSTNLTFDYASTINRPNFSSLSQIEVYLNPFLVFSRNINLRPTLTHELAANIQLREYGLRLSFFHQTDPVNWSAFYDPPADLFTTTLKNFERMYGMSATLSVPLSYKKWTSFNAISMNWNTIEDADALELASRPYLYVYTNHNFQLPLQFSLALNAWGFTRRQEGVYERNALVVAGIGISRTLFQKLSCTFQFNNIFNNRSFEERSSVNDVTAFNGFFVDNREFSLALKYSFGQIKSSYQQKAVNENNNRIK